MNIVIAPDSFKGSLSAGKVADTMERSIKDQHPNYTIFNKPMADGGEGTIDSLISATKGKRIPMICTGPLGEKIETTYAMIEQRTAIIECANHAGLAKVPEHQRNPDHTTTYGIGEAIIAALDQGCTSIMIGLGGSATNDGGLGMLLALGMKAWDANGRKVGHFGRDLHHVKGICLSELDVRLKNVSIKVACDVDNPLCGENGATVVYGPQKGATGEQVITYDRSLHHYGNIIEASINKSLQAMPGAGAAGGLGFALLAIGAEVVSGAQFIAEAMNIEESVQSADLVITGEGQSDEQTLYGKVPSYIATIAAKYDVPVVLISGSLEDVDQLNDKFSGCFSIANGPLSLEQCMEGARTLIYEQTKQIIRLISTIRR